MPILDVWRIGGLVLYLREERRRAFVCGLRLGRGANGTCTSTGGGCGYYLEDRGCALSIRTGDGAMMSKVSGKRRTSNGRALPGADNQLLQQ